MVRSLYSALLAVWVILGFASTSLSENLISYRVNTNSGSDWDMLVNDVTVVRYRPTGFGRCIYSGNINKAVTNGVNQVSLKRVGTSLAQQVPAGSFSIEINVLPDYRGQSEVSNMETILKYSGSETTNLFFNVTGEISTLKGASVGVSSKSSSLWPLSLFAGVVYFLFINVFGLEMVFKDRQNVKLRLPRIPTSSFIKNSILGGSLGLLIGMFFKRYNVDKMLRIWIFLILLTQSLSLAFLLSPSGKKAIKDFDLRNPVAFLTGCSDRAMELLHSADRTKVGDLPN